MKVRSILAALSGALLAGCGHVVYHAPNYEGRPFDFKRPPACQEATEEEDSPDVVSVRYLGAGGLAIGWQGETILTAPFFSNYRLPRVLFGRLAPNLEAIRKGMDGVPAAGAHAILACHSHYDHLGDLPVVARDYAPQARVYTNDAGVHLLAAALAGRTESLQGRLEQWIPAPDGGPSPIRFLAVESEHAPHVFSYHWGGGPVEKPWTQPWEKLRVRRLKGGTALAFVIDLLSPDRQQVRYRIYYQDSSSPEGKGEIPDVVTADGRPVDLAILCMASYNWAAGAPGALLRQMKPRHVLVTHYEDFFRSRDKPLRFVPLLSNRLANNFLGTVEESLRRGGRLPRGPVGSVCGPSGPEWTMPLPGETLRFEPEPATEVTP
jgi:L-ascorbate metabolism protein UlaG (beta-lactamase superfamily)